MITTRSGVVRNNIMLSYLIKGAAILVGMFTVRVYMQYFANYEILGIWYTVLAVLSWILNFDLGIGNGLRNMLSVSLVDNDERLTRGLISTGYAILGLVCGVIFLIGSLAILWLDWNSFFNVSQNVISGQILRVTIFLSFVGIVLQLYLKIVCSVLNAMEKTALTNSLALATNTLVLCFLCIPSFFDDAGNLVALSIAYFVAAVFPYAIATIVVFSKTLKNCRPKISNIESPLAKDIVVLGGKFLFVQVLLMTITVTNELYISWLFGASSVVEFQVYNKLFGTILTLYAIVASPIWSASAKAWHSGEIVWIRTINKKLLVFSAIASIGAGIVCLTLQPIFDIWLGAGMVQVSCGATLSFYLFTVVMLFSYADAAIANGIGLLKTQIICYSIAAILKYPLCALGASAVGVWPIVVLVNFLIMLPYAIIQPLSLNRAFTRRERELREK